MEVPHTTQKSFPLRISSVNVTKSEGNCRFSHIYWRNPYWKTSLSVQWQLPGCCFSDDICFIHSYRDFVVYNTLFVGTFRSSQQRCSIKKGFHKNFAKFTGKHLCWSLFFNKKENQTQAFSSEYCEIFKISIFTEDLWWTTATVLYIFRVNVSL